MAQRKHPPLRLLDFGRLEATEERAYSEWLLGSGYFDFEGAARKLSLGSVWTLVGAKGSGKTSSIEHLDILWNGQHDKLLSRWELADFPVADVTQVRVGVNPGPSSSRAAWQFLLLLRLFESAMRDQGASYPVDVVRLGNELRAAGLIGGDDLKTRFVDWTTSTFKFNILGFGAEAAVEDGGMTAMQVTEVLRRAFATIQSTSQHLLAIDGLDTFFAQTESLLESLSALVEATQSVNAYMRDLGLRFTTVLAIRSEMFTSLPSTDSAKIMDHAVSLDWSKGGTSNGNELWSLVNTKLHAASLDPVFLPVKDVRSAYLDTPIGAGPYSTIPEFLLSHTRLIPRDLIALMKEVQRAHPNSGQVTENEARNAVRAYCDNYFVKEISNNLSKILPGASALKVASFLEALSGQESRFFQARSLEKELKGVVSPGELRVLLRQLFSVGGIGVLSNGHTNFSYRRVYGGGFKYIGEFCLHNSLVVAWNIPWQGSAPHH